MDPYQKLGVTYKPDDDTVTRLVQLPCTTTEQHNSLPNQTIFTQDIPLNSYHKTLLRLYKPIDAPLDAKLALIVYIHGGGFVFLNASTTLYHDFCSRMATSLPVAILSVDYRLAPENRLPAAYDDAVEALNWVRDQAANPNSENHMLKDIVDFSKCYLMGDSAGGNIAYNAGLHALGVNLEPVVIRGYILVQPYFGGLERTQSELRIADDDEILTLTGSDLMWELSLPKGANRDHEYCNPMADGSFTDEIGLLRRCFVNARGGDILVDRQKEFVKMLEDKGVDVVTWFEDEGSHGLDILDPQKAQELFAILRGFIL